MRLIGSLIIIMLIFSGFASLGQEVTPEPQAEATAEITPEVTLEVTEEAEIIIADDRIDSIIQADFSTSNLTPLVGEPFELIFRVEIPEDVAVVEWPEFPEAWGDYMVLNVSERKIEALDDGSTVYTQRLDARLWAPGDYTIPETIVRYRVANEADAFGALARGIFITVPSVLENNDLNTLELKPDRPPIGFFYIPLWVSFLTLIVMTIGGWQGRKRYLRWQARRDAERNYVPPPTPAEVALDELKALRLSDGNLYYDGISDSLRKYIEHRLDIPAQDKTTTELLETLVEDTLLPGEYTSNLVKILEDVDTAKFTGIQPDSEGTRQLRNAAGKWVLSIEDYLMPDNPEGVAEEEIADYE